MDIILHALKLYWMQWPGASFEQVVENYLDGYSEIGRTDLAIIRRIEEDPRGVGAS